MNEFEEQFKSDEQDPSASILRTLMTLRAQWPNVLATWDGMVQEAVDHGWTELAARALVLSSVTADNMSIYANIGESDDDEDAG